MAEKRCNPNNQNTWDHGELKLSLNAVRYGYPSYERCHADKEECEGVSDDVVGGDAVHVSIVPQVVRVCKRGGLEIIHFFLVPTFQGSGYVVGTCGTNSSKSGDDTNSLRVG